METQELSQTVLKFNVKKGSYPLSSKNWDIQDNSLSKFNHRSMKSRTLSLIDSFEHALLKKKTMALGINVYSFNSMEDYNRGSQHHNRPKWLKQNNSEGIATRAYIFDGVYILDDLQNYIGDIPEYNQQKIKERYDLVRDCYFLKIDKHLKILAPMNNFAYQSNISAVDPIVFAVDNSKKSRHSAPNSLSGAHLIPLTWWG